MTPIATYRQGFWKDFRHLQRTFTLMPDHVLFQFQGGSSLSDVRIELKTLKPGPPDRHRGRDKRYGAAGVGAIGSLIIAILALLAQVNLETEHTVTLRGWQQNSFPAYIALFIFLAVVFSVVALANRRMIETLSFQNNIGHTVLSVSDQGGSRAEFNQFIDALKVQIEKVHIPISKTDQL